MIAALLALVPALPRPPPLWKEPPGPAAFAWLARHPPGRARALAASSLMLDTPYVEHPLGEGAGRDPLPRLRFDAVDCQTFVEEAIALGEAGNPAELPRVLDDVRYGASPTYEQRDHFMTSQWVPRNEAKGYVRDATRAYGGAVAELVHERITQARWSRQKTAIELPPALVPLGDWILPVVPLAKILDLAPKIPDGTVLLIVRADRPTFPERVSHLGFLVHHQGVPYLRHASTVFHRVVDEPLDHFVARNSRYDWWPVVGMSLLEIRDATKRLAGLPRPAQAAVK